MSHQSVSTTSDNGNEIVMTAEEHQEFQNLPALLTQWKRLQEERHKLVEQKRVILEQISELDTRGAVMSTMIMGTMKKHSIAALDLKSSNARAVYKKTQRAAPLKKKEFEKLVAEHLKSADEAKKLQEFLNTKRQTKVKETLIYEKNVTDT
jgi:hypothetical protein